MADNNPTARKTLARLAGNVIGWSFTSTLQVDGRDVAVAISQLDESDKIELAGRENVRALKVTCLISLLANCKIKEGDPCTLDADNTWQIRNWSDSPDGALRTFLLLDGN